MKIVAYVSWDSNPPPGVSAQTHKFTFTDALSVASMKFPPDQIVGPQMLMTGDVGAMVISTLPMTRLSKPTENGSLVSAGVKDNPNLYKLGTLARWKVFYDVSPENADKLFVVAPGKEDDLAVEITVTGVLVDQMKRPDNAPAPVELAPASTESVAVPPQSPAPEPAGA
jgi:hypothetical protein